MEFGLSNKETQIYIFLAKHGVLKAGEIAKQTKTPRPLVYRILKNLQDFGIVESTLESPTRFIAIPFEKALNKFIENRRKEIELIEKKKTNLLNDWMNINKTELESAAERFAVIEGNKKIYQKMSQMINDTKNQLCGMLTIPLLLRADKFGVFDLEHKLSIESKTQFQFITEAHDKNLIPLKDFFKSTPDKGFNFKFRNPQIGLQLSPQLVIRDNEEVIFFITPQSKQANSNESCLWTNCKALIKAFFGVFSEIWDKSIDVKDAMGETSSKSNTCIISDNESAKQKHNQIIRSAEKEITLISSSKGLDWFSRNGKILERLHKNGVITRIMVPIVPDNLDVVKSLSSFAEIRHISRGHLGTTIVDGKHLFQFKYLAQDESNLEFDNYYSNMLYSNDPSFVRKTQNMLEGIWDRASVQSHNTLDSLLKKSNDTIRHDAYKKSIGYVNDPKSVKLTEKDVLNKIINGKRFPGKNWLTNPVRYYGSVAQAIIHPPEQFKIPDMLVLIFHNNKQSSFGGEDLVNFFLLLETPEGHSFVPVAVIQDNNRSIEFRKSVFKGTPAENNIQVVNNDELQVRVQGDTLFAGWTVPVSFLNEKYCLPPSAILFEGFGDLKTEVIETTFPSGRKQNQERNFFEAFVTFLHPESKYVGPGTDGLLGRDVVFTSIPPDDDKK